MPIKYEKNTAKLSGNVIVDDAEGLLEWLQAENGRRCHLGECTHLHAANLQVLLAARPKIAAWPKDAALASWLKNFF